MGLEVATVAWISVAISVGATVYTMSQIPDNKSNDSIAGTKVTKNGTQSPRNRVYGTAIVGCTYVYSNVTNRDQSYRLDVFSVGGVGTVRFHNVWIDDVQMFEEHKDDLTDPANASSGIYNSKSMRSRYRKSDGFWMQWRSGQENQVASQLAINNSDGEWTVNHRGACVPHIVIVADYSTDQDYVFFSDRYNITALVSGADVFDPRTGKVNGESSNTALAVLDFLMNDYYGMGVTVDYIDMESFKYGATFCEKNDLRINSAIDASAKFADILQDMLACCGGALAIVDGKITFLVEEKVLAPIYELNEDDILKNSLKVSPADSGSYYNVVSTTFKSEINRDNDDDFVIPQNAVSDPRVVADGKIITKSLKMPYARDAFTSEGGVVKHCVKYMTNLVYNKAKFQMSCSFDIDLHEYQDLRPWDVIGITSEIYGFKNKLFRIQSMKVAADADRFNIATLHCIEYDHTIYEGQVEGTGSLPRPRPDDVVPAPKNVMFTLSSFVNTGYGLLAWEASCFTPSTAYDIEYKLGSASKWTRLTSAFRGTQFTLTDLKEARYDFRVRTYELFLGSSDWTTITNINVRPAYAIPEVTGLKVETSTPNFKFTWDDMTNVEVDNIPSSDAPNSAGSTGKLADVFHQYSIQIVVNGVMKYATTTKESTFTLDLEKNKEMMGGQPSRVITFRISIEDRLGNSSLVTELVANNRQIGVAGDVDVTNANGSATVEWSPCFEPDFAGTEVHISTTKGFTPSASTLHATLGKESFYVFPFPDKTTRYMRIAHFDTMGRDGLQYSPEITLTYDGVESAKSVRLISDSQTFHVNKSGVAAPSLIIMSAFTQNVEGSVKWTTSPSISLSSTSNPNERVLKYASMGNHDSVKVTVTVDGVSDTVTIFKVRDGQDGQDGQDGKTIYEQYRYGQVVNPDASWTAWGADMRTSDIYRQTRRVINDVPQAAGRVHRIAGMDGSNGADGERLFVVYHKNPVNQRPMPPEGSGNTGGWTEESEGANWMSQKLANSVDQPLTFWSFPIQMKGNDGEVDYSHVDEIAEAKKNEAIEASIASATASVEAAEVRAKAYADGVATEAEKAAIAAADAKANAAEVRAKAYADGEITKAEQAAIDEAERLAAVAEANAKSASDPKGSAANAQKAAIAAAEEKAKAAKVFAQSYADGVATEAEQAAIAAANAAANAAEVKAKAYADGKVTAAEQAAITEAERLAAQAEANAKAASDPKGSASKAQSTAQAYAKAQAEAAELRAKQASDPKGSASAAQQAAIAAADAKAKAAETRAKAYADGEVTKAEQAAIDEAERLANAAKAHADAELKKERKRQFDPHLTDPLKTFSKVESGTPDVISTLEGIGAIKVVSGVTGGNALSLTGDHWIYSTAAIPVDTSKKYKMVVKVRQTKDKTAGGNGFYAGVATLDRNYNNLSGGAGTHRYFCALSKALTVAGGWNTFEGYIQGVGNDHNNFREGTAYVRPMFIVNYSGGNGTAEVDEVRFYEVTERGDLVDLGFETVQGSQDKANAAKAAAEAYARSQAELAKTQAKAYADGEVTKAEQAAIAAAEAKVKAAETRAKAYADGEVTKAEQAAIAAADSKAKAAEAAAKSHADTKASQAESNAKKHADSTNPRVFHWVGNKPVPTNTNQDGAINLSFTSSFDGKALLGLKGSDFEGSGAAGIVGSFNGTALGAMNIAHQGLPDGSTTWFYHTVNLAKGNNVVRVWSTNSDGGSLLEAVVQFTGVNSDNRDIKINADGSLLGGGGGRVTPNGIGAETPSGAQSKANAARAAAEAYAKAQSEAAELRAKQASDPKGSASKAQQAAIAAADAKVNAAKVAMEAYADGVATDAEKVAIAAADAKANAAETRAKAYADGVVTEAESKAIAEADRLAKEAESRAKAASDPKGSAANVKGQAEAYARAQANAVEVRVKAYADGKVTDAEKAAIAAADAKANAAETRAKAYADGKVTAAERDAIAEAERLATTAETNAKKYTADQNDELLTHSGSLFANSTFGLLRADKRPAGVFSSYGSNAASVVAYSASEKALQIYSGADTTIGASLSAMRVNPNQKYRINLKVRSNASCSSGFYFRIAEYDGNLPSGALYVSGNSTGEAGIVTGTRQITTFYENKGVATTWTNLEFTYTPSNTAKWFSPFFLNWDGMGKNSLFISECVIISITGVLAAKDKLTASEVGADAAGTAAAVGQQAQSNLDNRIPQGNADALKTMMSNEGLRYYRKITIGGDANKYYPVIINGGNQDKLRTIKIWRGYSETAPSSWHTSTHKGALMLTWQGNFGGWGGATYRSTILEHSEAYTTILADCYIVNHSMGFAFFLRGGGAVYHIASDMDIAGVERTNPSGGGSGIYLDSSLNSYVNSTQPYKAPAALTSVNAGRINDLKTAYNGQGQYIKNLNADNITAGKVAAQYVHADVYNGTLVNATNIKAGMLDADHINTRTFTGENAIFDAEVYGGVLTGAVVRTGSTGARAEMREDGYKFAAYNSQNKPTFYVDANGNVVMNSGSISSDVLSEASRNSNIVTWIGTAGKGGNMQFTDNSALQNDVNYFPITNNYYTTGKNGTLNVQYCAANGYLFQDERSAVGAAAPAQKTLPANAAPTVYFVDGSNTTKGAVMRMTIKYTTQAANGTAPSKSNPSGTQGWRKTYAHFHIDNIATHPNVAAGTNVKGYKLCINVGASSIKTALKALNRVPDVVSYSEVAEGGRYLPHSYKLVWSGAANSVTNSWGSGLYMVQGHDRGDWHDAGFIFVLDENHYGSAAPRSIFPAYAVFYEYRYDTKIFKSSSGNITRIFKLTGV